MVSENTESGVIYQPGLLFKARTQERVVCICFPVFQIREKIADASLIVAVEHNHVVKAVICGVLKGNLMRAAKTVVVPVSQKGYLDWRLIFRKSFPDRFFAFVCAAVVYHDHFVQIGTYIAGKLTQNTSDLLFTVVHGDEKKCFFHKAFSSVSSGSENDRRAGATRQTIPKKYICK